VKAHPNRTAIDAEERDISTIHLDRRPHLFDGEGHAILDTPSWPRHGIHLILRSITKTPSG
jgi:hypothetical protein